MEVRLKDGGLMVILAVAQMRQMVKSQRGQRAQHLAINHHSTPFLPAAGGETITVDSHSARQSDR